MSSLRQLNAAKKAKLDEQQAILNRYAESKMDINGTADDRRFSLLTKEIDSINMALEVQRGQAEVASPRESAVYGSFGSDHDRTYRNCTSEYATAFWQTMAKKKITNTAALSEGGTAADGSFLVPQETSTTIANLAMEEVSARKLSRCIVTEMDLKLPYQASRSVVTAKAESTDQGSTAFGVSVPTFATTTLSAFMHGQQVSVSWELQQDVAALSSFLTDEFNRSTTTYEESVFVNGSGSGEPEGYLTGATAFETVALSSDSILDLIASVRKDYFAGSSFLLSRSEFHRLYKAQIAADQFQQFVTYDANGAAKLLGFPVFFSSEMPTYVASPSTNGAVLFGNFRAGFCLGDRGDSSIHVKILDQVSAVNGQTVYVCWRRSDQRCVLAEAVSLLTTNG